MADRLFPSAVKAYAARQAGLNGSNPPTSTAAALSAVATDTEMVMLTIIQEAMEFSRHSRRGRLTTRDVEEALRARGMAPPLGFIPSAETVTTAPMGTNRTLFQPSVMEFVGNKGLNTFKSNGGANVNQVDVDDDDALPLLKRSVRDLDPDGEVPRIPLSASVHSHWLAVGSAQVNNDAISQDTHPRFTKSSIFLTISFYLASFLRCSPSASLWCQKIRIFVVLRRSTPAQR